MPTKSVGAPVKATMKKGPMKPMKGVKTAPAKRRRGKMPRGKALERRIGMTKKAIEVEKARHAKALERLDNRSKKQIEQITARSKRRTDALTKMGERSAEAYNKRKEAMEKAHKARIAALEKAHQARMAKMEKAQQTKQTVLKNRSARVTAHQEATTKRVNDRTTKGKDAMEKGHKRRLEMLEKRLRRLEAARAK